MTDQAEILVKRISANLEIRPLRSMKYSNARSIKRALSWLTFELSVVLESFKIKNKPDVIIASSPSIFTFLTGYFLSLRFKSKFIVEVRDIWPLTIVGEGLLAERNLVIRALELIEEFAYKKAHAIVGIMPNLVSQVERVSSRTEGIYCVPQGCSQDLIGITGPKNNNSLLEIPSLKNKFVVGYAGSIGSSNSLDTLFEAAKILKIQENIHFLIIGDGKLRNNFKKKYEGLGNITFVSRLAQQDLHGILSKCDLLYFGCDAGSLWQYGQSLNKLIDYMLSSRPILGSYSGFKTMINEANCGIYVPAMDSTAVAKAIECFTLLSHETLSEMGAKGRNWVIENRNFEKLSSEYNDVIVSLWNLK